jgi:hypothetical protein
MHRRVSLAYVAVLLVTVSTTAARANLIVNPGFESPALNAGGGFQVYSVNQNVGGWTVGNNANFGTGNNVTLERTPALPMFNWCTPNSGAQYLDLTGVANQPGSYIEQVVPTVQGQLYQLDYFAGSANSLYHTPPITVNAAVFDVQSAQQLMTDTYTTTASPSFNQVIWQQHAAPVFQATGTQTLVRFTNTFSQQDAALIDDVHMDRVPEPGGCAMFAVGAVILGRLPRRRVA